MPVGTREAHLRALRRVRAGGAGQGADGGHGAGRSFSRHERVAALHSGHSETTGHPGAGHSGRHHVGRVVGAGAGELGRSDAGSGVRVIAGLLHLLHEFQRHALANHGAGHVGPAGRRRGVGGGHGHRRAVRPLEARHGRRAHRLARQAADAAVVERMAHVLPRAGRLRGHAAAHGGQQNHRPRRPFHTIPLRSAHGRIPYPDPAVRGGARRFPIRGERAVFVRIGCSACGI